MDFPPLFLITFFVGYEVYGAPGVRGAQGCTEVYGVHRDEQGCTGLHTIARGVWLYFAGVLMSLRPFVRSFRSVQSASALIFNIQGIIEVVGLQFDL